MFPPWLLHIVVCWESIHQQYTFVVQSQVYRFFADLFAPLLLAKPPEIGLNVCI